jgi:hypothetical protein
VDLNVRPDNIRYLTGILTVSYDLTTDWRQSRQSKWKNDARPFDIYLKFTLKKRYD